MAGRRIRWANAARVAAIGAAVIAGIVSLPALLGNDRPPPVPADVGLVPPPAAPPVPVQSATEPLGPEPSSAPVVPGPHTRRSHHHTRKPRHRHHHRRRRRRERREDTSTQATAPTPVSVPAYSPPERGEFTIESP